MIGAFATSVAERRPGNALARQDIDVRRIASAHDPRVATMDDLGQALGEELSAVQR